MVLRTPKEALAPRPPVEFSTPPAAPVPPWLRHAMRTALHLACDATAVAAAFYGAYLLRFRWGVWVSVFPISGELPDWGLYERMLYAVVPLWLLIFGYSSRIYSSPWLGAADRFLQILKGCLLGTAATLVATYIYSRLEYSRMMLVLTFPISAAAVTFSHALVLAFDRWLARHEAARPVLLVGGDLVAQEIRARIKERHPEAQVFELKELPPPEDLAARLRERPFYELILARSSLSHDRILETAEVCDAFGTGFKMLPDLLELRLGEVQMDASLGLPAYRIQHTSLTRLNFAAKRGFDLAFSALVLLVTALPLALICLLIKLDSRGPVLYKQKRYGFKGRVFEAYKFRTMAADAESRIQTVQEQNGGQGAFFKVRRDPRVTRVGRWLRRFSLDEFPQFLNVLRGEMSVVGPRPLAVSTGERERLEAEFGPTARKRVNALPGITGLWQVSGRSDVSSEQRFALDLFYVEHWSLGLDLEIILKTVPAMLTARGAY